MQFLILLKWICILMCRIVIEGFDEEREEYYEFEGAQWDEYKDNCDKIPTLYDIAGIVTVIIDRLCTM